MDFSPISLPPAACFQLPCSCLPHPRWKGTQPVVANSVQCGQSQQPSIEEAQPRPNPGRWKLPSCQHLRPPRAATSQPRKFPSPLGNIFLWPLPGAIHFITLCLLFLLLAHKQCGQFRFTCPGVSDSSPASMALSGYTVKCLANKMHKAEIGKSMPLLITLHHPSRGLSGRAARWSRRQRHHSGGLPLGQVPAGPGFCALCPLPSCSRSRSENPGRGPPRA